jgi:hydrogenase maturation protein HypF
MDWQPDVDDTALLQQAWQQRVNCPQTSAVGRLFDGAAALLDLVQQASFEGQAPMWLEAAADATPVKPVELPLQQDDAGVWRSDWSPLLTMLLDQQMPHSQRARCFHDSLATTLVQQAETMRQQYGDFRVGLCGGVFQNRLLTGRVAQLLLQAGFRYTIPQQVPLNDAGLCYGQVIEAAATNEEQETT